MRRDMDLIRKILLNAESGQLDAGIDGVSDDALKYHQALAIEAGLLKGKFLSSLDNAGHIPSAVFVLGITWEGHDFIDAIREDTNWHKVKSFLADAGKQVTIETVKVAAANLKRMELAPRQAKVVASSVTCPFGQCPHARRFFSCQRPLRSQHFRSRLYFLASRAHSPHLRFQRVTGMFSPNHSFKPKPLRGSA